MGGWISEGRWRVSDDLDVEVLQDAEVDREYYVDKIPLEELRRYVCLDMSRMCGPLPEKVVKLAKEMETYLLGNRPNVRAVE